MSDKSDRPDPLGTTADSELLRLVIESATDFAILTEDLDGIVTSWNSGAERLLEYTAEQIIGRSGDAIYVPEDRRAGVHDEERRRALTEGRAEDERWQMRRDGSRFWASGLLMPLKDGSGFARILRDRTAQYRAEESVRKSEARFRLLATSIPQLVFLTRPDGSRTWGSPQWIEFTGLGLDASLGGGWLDAVHPADREATQRAWQDTQAGGEYYVEHRIRRQADGEWRWHQTRARPLPGDGETAADWVGTSTDIHDLRTLQDRQRVLLDELQHRTRNLLAVVQSISRQTLRTSASLQGFGAEFESRLRALGRVQGLLARTDHQGVELQELIEAELTAHGDGQDEPGKVRVDGLPVTLPAGDAQILALAIHELATNAVKYGALGQPAGKLAVTWRLEGEGSGRHVVLDWTESGVSMQAGGPSGSGYGRELIERALPYQLGARTQLEFGPDGVRCTLEVPAVAAGQVGSYARGASGAR